jgi:hypothetical protein
MENRFSWSWRVNIIQVITSIAIIGSGYMFAAKMLYDIHLLEQRLDFYTDQQGEIKAKLDLISSALIGQSVRTRFAN